MAAILATVDIEDLATAKVKGIKDALTDLVQTQQQVAASSAALASGTAGVIASMGASATSTTAAGASIRDYAARMATVAPAVRDAGNAIAALGGFIQQQQVQAAEAARALQTYIAGLGGVIQTARDGSAPLQAQAAALADIAEGARAGVPGLAAYKDALLGMANQLAAGEALGEEQIDLLARIGDGFVAANREALGAKTALQQLAEQQQAASAAIRDNYQSLQLLTGQLTEGTTLTKLQAEALAELAEKAQAGNGFTKEQAAALAELSSALKEGVTLTAEQAAKLQELTAEYEEANAATLGYKQVTEDAATAVEQLLAAHRESEASIRQTYEALGVLGEQIKADTVLTEGQIAALRELQTTLAAQGMGAYADTLGDLAEAGEKGEKATEEQTEALKQVQAGYGEAQKAALGFNEITEASIGVFQRAQIAAVALSASLIALGQSALHYAEEASHAAARSEILAVALNATAKNANANEIELIGASQSLQKLGILSDQATESIIKFTQSELKAGDAIKLANVAKNIAIVANKSTGETYDSLTRAVEMQSTRMLKQYGIVINNTKAFKDYALELGKNVKELDDIDRKQALVNAILEEGAKFAGLNAAAAGLVGKQYSSLTKLADDMLAKIGEGLLPIFQKWTDLLTGFYNKFLALPDWMQKATSAMLAFLGSMATFGAFISGAKLLGFLDLLGKIAPQFRAANAAASAARTGLAVVNPALVNLAKAAGGAATGVGILRASLTWLATFFGGGWVAILAGAAVAISFLTAKFAYHNSVTEETIQKQAEYVAAAQAGIAQTEAAVAAVDKLTTTYEGHTVLIDQSKEGQEAYNRAIDDLRKLVPGAVGELDTLNKTYKINKDVVAAATEEQRRHLKVLADTAAALLPATKAAYDKAKADSAAKEKEVIAAQQRVNELQRIGGSIQERLLPAAREKLTLLQGEHTALVTAEAAARTKIDTDEALIRAMKMGQEAQTNLNDAYTNGIATLEKLTGGFAKLPAEMKKAGLEEQYRNFQNQTTVIRELDKATGKYITTTRQMTAAEARKAVSELTTAYETYTAKQKAAAEALEKKSKAAAEAVFKRDKVDAEELSGYRALETIFEGLTVGTEAWRRAIERHQPMLNQFLKSGEYGKQVYQKMNEVITLTNKYMSDVVPQSTIDEFQNLNAALTFNKNNAEEYQATLKRGASLIQQWTNMTADERKQLGDVNEVMHAATVAVREYALEQQKLAEQQKTREQLGQMQIDLLDKYQDKLEEATRAEEDAARARRDAQIQADEAIYQSRQQIQNDIAEDTLRGQELLDYETQRRIQDVQHRYEFEKKQRELALQDEENAVELKIRLAEEEIDRRIAGMIRLRRFEIDMMQQAARDAEALAARRPGDERAREAAQEARDRAEIAEAGFAAYSEGLAKIRDEELRLQQTTNKRLRDTVAANKKAADEILAQQRVLADEQIKAILKNADAHTVAAELAKQAWKGVASAVSTSLFDMLKKGQNFSEGMKSVWDGLKQAAVSVWERIRDSVFDIMQEMLEGWIANLLKMKTASAGANVFGGGAMGGGAMSSAGGWAAASGGYADWQGPVQQAKPGFSLVPSKFAFGQGSTAANVGAGIGGGIVGAQVGYGIGGATGSYGKGIASGAATGAALGAYGGPIGMGVGAAIGAFGGWLGARKARADAEKLRKEILDTEGGLEKFEKRAAEAGTSLSKFLAAKTPQQVNDAIKELNKAFDALTLKKAKEELRSTQGELGVFARRAREAGIDLQKVFDATTVDDFKKALDEAQKALELHKAKEGLGTTYAQLQKLSKQAQLVGYDLNKLYDAKTIEEFNDEQERLNQLLAEQQERLQALDSATEGLQTWATGFSQTLQRGFEDAFPKTAEVEQFYKKFKEAQDRGFKGTALDFSKQMKTALPMDEFMKLWQEGIDKGFKGTMVDLAKHLGLPAEMIEKLTKLSAGAQDEFTNLGITAAASFAAIVRETGDIQQAMKQLSPTLDQLIEAQDKWGLKADESFGQLIQFRRIIKDNEDIFNSIGGITQALKGLTDANALTEESFDAMGRTAVEKYNLLKQRTGDAKLSLLSMQPTLQALWEAQKKFGFTVDDATQALIDQGVANGMVGANMQSVDQKMLDILGLIAQALGVAKDKLDAIVPGTALDDTNQKLKELHKQAEVAEQGLADLQEQGEDGAEIDPATRQSFVDLAQEVKVALEQMRQAGQIGEGAGGAIQLGTNKAVLEIENLIRKAEAAELALRNMGLAGEQAGSQIETSAGYAAEGRSPTGIKAIVDRTYEAHEAMRAFSWDFVRGAKQIEDSAAQIAAIDMGLKVDEKLEKFPTGEVIDLIKRREDDTRNVAFDTLPIDKFGDVINDLWQQQLADTQTPVSFIEPAATTAPETPITVHITQEGTVISVNALDNANMEEAWRTKILPEYLRHIDNNTDQLAERTETAVARYRRRHTA